jgi:hypothetical protein
MCGKDTDFGDDGIVVLDTSGQNKTPPAYIINGRH